MTASVIATDDARVARLVDWYEQLTPAGLRDISALYVDDARFKDPFNEVQGSTAIARLFEHMFATLHSPRFTIVDAVCDARACVLIWDFHFQRASGAPLRIRGASHIEFSADGRVTRHRDYWDAAEELYAKLPVLGTLMRWLRRRASAG